MVEFKPIGTWGAWSGEFPMGSRVGEITGGIMTISGIQGDVEIDINPYRENDSDFRLEVQMSGGSRYLKNIDVIKDKGDINILGTGEIIKKEGKEPFKITVYLPQYNTPHKLELIDVGGKVRVGFVINDISLVTAGDCFAEIMCIDSFSCVAGGKSNVTVQAVNKAIGRLETDNNAQITIDRAISEGGYIRASGKSRIIMPNAMVTGASISRSDGGLVKINGKTYRN